MAVRTAYVGTQVPGDVLTGANFTKTPGGWIGDATAVANQSTITTEVDITSLSTAVTVGTSRRIRISVFLNAESSVAADSIRVNIKEGATQLQLALVTVPAANRAEFIFATCTVTPTPGAHTYKATVLRSAGTGNVQIDSSATNPALLLVEDIGPAA